MANYPTPHIHAKPGDFGKTVLMPGDPLRSKFIAENFLENAVLVNNVRGIHGYTGTYRGVKVSVMASGMGMPSIGIYSWELFTIFGVENIMRIGSTGAMQENINLRDIVIGQGACTDSNWAGQYHLPGTFAPIADYHMLETCVETAKELELPYHVGNILSSDRFYGDDGDMTVCDLIEGEEQNPAETAAFTEFSELLPKAIDALPQKYGEVLKLRNAEDLSYEEIASRLGLSVGTVKSRLSRAREYLREELEKLK